MSFKEDEFCRVCDYEVGWERKQKKIDLEKEKWEKCSGYF